MSLADDGHTYGFSKHDAEQLANAIGGGDVEFNDRFIRFPVAASAGITLYYFILTSSGFETTKQATAQMYETNGFGFGAAVAVGTIYDPSGIALGLRYLEAGLCIKQDGEYIVVSANPDRSLIVRAPAGGIPARSGSTMGQATCVVYGYGTGSLATTANSVIARNLSTTAVAADAYVQVNREAASDLWIVSNAL